MNSSELSPLLFQNEETNSALIIKEVSDEESSPTNVNVTNFNNSINNLNNHHSNDILVLELKQLKQEVENVKKQLDQVQSYSIFCSESIVKDQQEFKLKMKKDQDSFTTHMKICD